MAQSVSCFNWKLCLVCQEKSRTGLVKTTFVGLKSLAEDLLLFWEIGELDLDVDLLADSYVDGKPRFYETFVAHNATYHKNCRSRYNKFHFQKKQRKVQTQNKDSPSTSAQPSTRLSTRSSTEIRSFASNFCCICSKTDSANNLCAGGTYHASQLKVDSSINEEKTELIMRMVVAVKNDFFA